jgi:hypothetical protein
LELGAVGWAAKTAIAKVIHHGLPLVGQQGVAGRTR